MRIVIIVITLLLFQACKQEKKVEEEQTQMEQVMMVHDEVMPKMGTLSKLVTELKSKIDTTANGQSYEAAMKDLQEANKAMMDWMKGFGNRFDSDEILKRKALSEQKKKWLDEEDKKVRHLKEQINSSIANAEKLLNQ